LCGFTGGAAYVALPIFISEVADTRWFFYVSN